MSKASRNVRVRELLRQVLSDLLHTRYQAETVHITLTDVEVAPDHRSACVYYTVLGGQEREASAHSWFRKFGGELRFQLGKKVTLKSTPALRFEPDPSVARGNRILALIDEIESSEKARAADPT